MGKREMPMQSGSASKGVRGSATRDIRPEFVIRPGVRFPDWHCIQSSDAEAALLAMFRAVRVERRWTDYSPTLDRVRVSILRRFAAGGHGPSLVELAHATGIPREEVSVLLGELASRDLVVLGKSGRVTGAYPFTSVETEHSVRRGALQRRAMCAVDALGIGAMLGEDVEVLSSCRACASPIRVQTAREGTALHLIEPAEAVVRVGEEYNGNCGATSLCASIAFFCSDAHLDGWRSSAGATGRRLTVDEAHQVGCAIFAPSLRGVDAQFP